MEEHTENNFGDTLGANIPMVESVSSREIVKYINELFVWIDDVSRKKVVITHQSLSHYFSENIIYQVNGEILASDSDELFSRFTKLVNLKKSIQVALPLEFIVVGAMQVSVLYKLKLVNLSGLSYVDTINTTIKLGSDLRITSWDATIQHD